VGQAQARGGCRSPRLELRVNQLGPEFSRRGGEDLELLKEFSVPFELGVTDVKARVADTPDSVAQRIRKVIEFVPAERVVILPDCGLFHVPRDIAFAKLRAMVQGARIVRKEMGN
jgi:5-methyltetrahydropteroyltriglutamate--homocysteine methyltransferase